MTDIEKREIEKRHEVVQFLKDHKMHASDLATIVKRLCCCGTCYFFVQHYTKDGEGLDWGHCRKGNVQHSKKVSTASCGFWEDCPDEEND